MLNMKNLLIIAVAMFAFMVFASPVQAGYWQYVQEKVSEYIYISGTYDSVSYDSGYGYAHCYMNGDGTNSAYVTVQNTYRVGYKWVGGGSHTMMQFWYSGECLEAHAYGQGMDFTPGDETASSYGSASIDAGSVEADASGEGYFTTSSADADYSYGWSGEGYLDSYSDSSQTSPILSYTGSAHVYTSQEDEDYDYVWAGMDEIYTYVDAYAYCQVSGDKAESAASAAGYASVYLSDE